MRITFVVPYDHFSGGIKVIAIYAERLRRRGHDVVVVSPAPPRITLRDRARALIRERRLFFPPVGSHFEGRNVDLRIYRPYRPIENRDVPDADVIIGTWFETALWVARLSPQKGARTIFIQGYETLPEEPRPEIDETWRLPFHKIVISRWLKRLAAEKFGDTQVTHIPNSVDTNQFFAPVRNKQPIPTIGFLVNASPFKGLRTTLQAVEEIRRNIPNLQVVAFGHKPLGGELVLPNGCEYHVNPPQDKIRDIYAKCDVWLCGSRREGFHLPPLEAMACRCPVVSTRVGGPEDIVVPGRNGYLVDIGDAGGLAAAAVSILNASREEWRSLSDAALNTATSYTWEDAAVLFEDALALAMDRAGRGEIAGGPGPQRDWSANGAPSLSR